MSTKRPMSLKEALKRAKKDFTVEPIYDLVEFLLSRVHENTPDRLNYFYDELLQIRELSSSKFKMRIGGLVDFDNIVPGLMLSNIYSIKEDVLDHYDIQRKSLFLSEPSRNFIDFVEKVAKEKGVYSAAKFE